MMKKGKKSGAWVGIAASRLQQSWKTIFVFIVFLVLATTTLMIDLVFQAARIHSVHLVKGLPTAASRIIPKRIIEDVPKLETHGSVLQSKVDPLASDLQSKIDPLVSDLQSNVEPLVADLLSKLEPRNSGLTYVRDIVAFPEEVMLLVEAAKGSSSAPTKDDLVCLFGTQHKTGVFTIEWQDDLHSVLAVRCEHPPEQVLLESNRKATLLFKGTDFAVPSAVDYTTNSSWIPLVYETVTDSDSVILFVKGLLDSKGKPDNFSRSLDKLHCRFGNDVKSQVKVIAQEVVRCALPPEDALKQLGGARVSLFVPQMGLLPSVAYFSNPPPPKPLASSGDRQFHICACTMLWNEARFLREWIIYHGFLGIERWYLYDNNSDDDIEEVLSGLQPVHNVSRHPWPWMKTQEAGFSHCALRARADCEWVLFADVDEFVYPTKDLLEMVYGNSSKKLPKSWVESKAPVNWTEVVETASLAASAPNRTSVLWRLINKTLKKGAAIGKKVGEVRLVCHNFGPSGLSLAPKDGVMVGYTCRMQWPQRHKSFIYLDAISDSLLNVVHHFALKDEYREMAVHARIAVINHYKYQAWEVFKAKFVRRVATYVVDWREQTALSNDRAPGLGLEAVEPEDWPSRYCEEVDWGLKNFTENAFRHPETKLMPW